MTRARDNSFNPFNNQVAGKNLVINGAFDIWQRGASITGLTANNTYTADRWNAGTAGTYNAYATRQLVNDPVNLPNIQYCMRYGRTSGTSNLNWMSIAQSIETVNSIPYAGRRVTFSFYMRAGSGLSAANSRIEAYFIQGTGTDQNSQVSITNPDYYSVYSGVNLTTNWQRFSITGNIAANTTQLHVMFSYAPIGTAGANDYFEVTGVQVELGSNATQFSRAGGTIGGELALCQRYYQTLIPTATYQDVLVGTAADSTAYYRYPYVFPVKMRSAPTIGTSGTVSDYANLASTGLSPASSLPAFESARPDGCSVICYSANVTKGFSASLRNGSNNSFPNGWLNFNSEL